MSGRFLLARLLYWLKGLSEDPVELFTVLGVESSDRVLEIGCAIGYHTLALAQIASQGKVYAVDVWEEGLAYLRARADPGWNVETICCSAEAVGLPAASLDKVVCFNTLHHVPDPERAVERWVESLKQGGQVLYRDLEISPERIQAFSKDCLRQAGTIRGINVLVRR